MIKAKSMKTIPTYTARLIAALDYKISQTESKLQSDISVILTGMDLRTGRGAEQGLCTVCLIPSIVHCSKDWPAMV